MSFGEQSLRDPIAIRLERYAQNILILVFGLLPLIFYPSVLAPFENTKILVAIGGLACGLILFSLSVLRSGKITFGFSYALCALWGVAIVTLISAGISGDLRDALVGDLFSTHSAAFVGLLALTASLWMIMGIEKVAIMRLYILLSVSTLVLAVFHVLRLVFGADLMSFGVFVNAVATPIGGWNDLALYMGLTVLLSLLTLEQLPLTKPGRILFALVVLVALGMLSIINFIYVWYVLGLVSLVMLVYTLGKDRFATGATSTGFIKNKIITSTSLGYSLVVFAVSVLFIIGGSSLGGFIAQHTGISYVEVRPSFTATVDIARGVYGENAFLGIGANKFADAWRLYKDPAINPTVFWNTDFNAGNGYIPTFFVTTGVFGALAWAVFFGLFIYYGVRVLLKAPEGDRMWYFIGTSAFVGAVYIWTMSIVYVPGAVLLLVGAMCTGLTFVAGNALQPASLRTFALGTNRRMGFVVTLVVIAVIIGSVNVLYAAGRHYGATYTFNNAAQMLQGGSSLSDVQTDIVRALEMSRNDIFARRVTEYQLSRMNALLALQSPTEADQQEFQDALINAVYSGQLATDADKTEPANWAVLGGVYSLLVSANIEGAYDKARESLTKAKDLDPINPLHHLMLAQLEARANNVESARAHVGDAIRLKQNYTDAFFFSTQLDIAAGNVAGAIASTQSIIALEPQNPARYYQLGVLQSAQGETDAAVRSFERARDLDTNYANARYFLALGYDVLGRSEDAKRELEKVLELNPGNQDVISLIETISTTGSLASLREQGIPNEQPLTDNQEAGSETEGPVTTNKNPDSTVVTPVNNIPAEQKETIENSEAEAETTE